MESLGEFCMIAHTDNKGLITYTNKKFLKTSEWTPKRVLSKTLWQMFPQSEEGQKQADAIWNSISLGKTWSGVAEKITRSNNPYFVKLLAIPVIPEGGGLTSVIFMGMDITEDVQLREKLQEIAFIDQDTGLMSRHKLENIVNQHIAETKSFSFVYLTIDHFYTLKGLQSYGGEIIFIQSFTNRLKRYFKDNPIARIGASEFVILSPFGDWYVQGFLRFLEQHPIYINNTALPLSISGGIVRYPEDKTNYSHLMEAALVANKEVISSGGGKITSPSAKSNYKLNRNAIIDRNLLTALNRNDLHVVYQPQLDVATGKIFLYEAFVRWEDEELGVITPDEFIPIAEDNGFIHKLGTFVIEEAAKLAVSLKNKGSLVNMTINSSVREFTNPNLSIEIVEILSRVNCPPSLIELDITEKFALQAEQESSILLQMKELQNVGIEFALDDFGTGYASFRYMQSLPITKIKIDKLFISSLLTHTKTQQLVQGMIHFGKTMGMYVIAEGVETEEQFNLLTTMGIDAVQGYYIGAPVTAEAISK
ncbi:EAL domain-containing protein [Sporosarcina sp. G11-34]|nr:EAL domain-containing protein [Sporosarcina sp. G11-34]